MSPLTRPWAVDVNVGVPETAVKVPVRPVKFENAQFAKWNSSQLFGKPEPVSSPMTTPNFVRLFPRNEMSSNRHDVQIDAVPSPLVASMNRLQVVPAVKLI